MAKNYKIDAEKEIIYVSLGNLTAEETAEVMQLKTLGYKVMPKRTTSAKTPKENDILKWFDDNGKTAEKKEFEAKKKEKIVDKNGKEREGGYLIAIKWFRDNFPTEYKEIKANL